MVALGNHRKAISRPHAAHEKCRKALLNKDLRQWSGAGSNRRHRPFQGRALPTELPDQLFVLKSGPLKAAIVSTAAVSVNLRALDTDCLSA